MYGATCFSGSVRRFVSTVNANVLVCRLQPIWRRDQYTCIKSVIKYIIPSRQYSTYGDTYNAMKPVSENMLTRETAIHFLQNAWNMNDVELQLRRDREKFLNKLIVAVHERVPFQFFLVIKYLLGPPEARKVLSFEEIEKLCMLGTGGNCFTVNMFTLRLLRVLGFSAHPCMTTASLSASSSSHLVVIVKDLAGPGDLHIVDCGLGQPSFRAIPLTFHEESPAGAYRDSFLEYKYIKRDGKILRMHGDGDLVKRNDPPIEGVDFILGKWRRMLEFTLEDFERRTLEGLGTFYDLRLTDKDPPAPMAARYPGGKAVIIVRESLFLEQVDGTLKKTKLRSSKEIFQAYRDYFPTIDEDLVKDGYSLWQTQ